MRKNIQPTEQWVIFGTPHVAYFYSFCAIWNYYPEIQSPHKQWNNGLFMLHHM